jgi:hypothetical protein
MSTLSELIAEGKKRRVVLKNQKGKPLINISLLLAVILIVAAPQLLLCVLILVLLEIIDVEYDGKELSLDG